jgi:hypothetical protein
VRLPRDVHQGPDCLQCAGLPADHVHLQAVGSLGVVGPEGPADLQQILGDPFSCREVAAQECVRVVAASAHVRQERLPAPADRPVQIGDRIGPGVGVGVRVGDRRAEYRRYSERFPVLAFTGQGSELDGHAELALGGAGRDSVPQHGLQGVGEEPFVPQPARELQCMLPDPAGPAVASEGHRPSQARQCPHILRVVRVGGHVIERAAQQRAGVGTRQPRAPYRVLVPDGGAEPHARVAGVAEPQVQLPGTGGVTRADVAAGSSEAQLLALGLRAVQQFGGLGIPCGRILEGQAPLGLAGRPREILRGLAAIAQRAGPGEMIGKLTHHLGRAGLSYPG